MSDEISRLEAISDFYKKGDLMDALLVEREADLIRQVAARPGKAIEIGCGNGHSTQLLVDIFDDLTVLEPSAKNLDLMKGRVSKNIKALNGLLEDYPAEEKFDYVVFLNVLEHVDDPFASLKKIESLMSDEGVAFLSVPNCMSLNRRAGYRMGLLKSYETMAQKDHDLGHRRLYTVAMLRDHIERCGLRVESMKGVYLKPLAESQMVALGMDAVKAFYALGEDVPEYCANLFAVVRKAYY
jgi:2-polyprenyl-3-methyl-5-hydroxy-6-metoxy-1,4-benzoquinol methylase